MWSCFGSGLGFFPLSLTLFSSRALPFLCFPCPCSLHHRGGFLAHVASLPNELAGGRSPQRVLAPVLGINIQHAFSL